MTGGTAGCAELGDSDPRLYIQVARSVRRQIKDGVLPSGSAVPSIAALAGEHGCSRDTCLKAVRVLRQEELVVCVPGLGYFVAGEGSAS